MGDLLLTAQAQFTTDTLNDQFGPQNVGATFATIEELRKTFPNLLNPKQQPTVREKRKQTPRFAALQINDGLVFDGTYPAPKFTKWLKWLTWLNTQQGNLILDGGHFNGTAGELVVQVLAKALPPGGQPSPVQFSFSHDSNVGHFKVEAITIGSFHVNVTSPDHSEVNGVDEDDV
jgi:hypothetical protein